MARIELLLGGAIPDHRELDRQLHTRMKPGGQLALSKILDLVNATGPVNSMEAPMGSTNLTLGETMVDETDGPFESTVVKERSRVIQDLMSELPQRARAILTMRFGFVDGETVHLDVCVDCFVYLANGEEPESWKRHPGSNG